MVADKGLLLFFCRLGIVGKADYVQADETTTPVMNKETHKAAKEYLWMVRAVIQQLPVVYRMLTKKRTIVVMK
jgi:hypothetical protein